MGLEAPRRIEPEELAAVRPRAAENLRNHPLYLVGGLEGLARPTVAIVGTRAPSEPGRQRARDLAAALGSAGICVVSGLALGIDGAAHEGALAATAPTVGVLGGGHRRFFPNRNLGLARRMIAAGGAVVSPFPPDHAAFPAQFLQRNGIVAALADGLVVVEAAARSGALNTAGWAGDLGIPVMAFPGEVDRPKAAGCLALIRDGAVLVRGPDDVFAELGIGRLRLPAAPVLAPDLAPLEQALLAGLADGELGIDALVARCAAPPATVVAALGRLEIEGHIARSGPATFIRVQTRTWSPGR